MGRVNLKSRLLTKTKFNQHHRQDFHRRKLKRGKLVHKALATVRDKVPQQKFNGGKS